MVALREIHLHTVQEGNAEQAQSVEVTHKIQRTVVSIDHMCCAMEAKVIRDVLGPISDVIDVKISVVDRRCVIEHRPVFTTEQLLAVLNEKHLGASVADTDMTEGSKSTISWRDLLRASVGWAQILFFLIALVLNFLDRERASTISAIVSIVLAWPMVYSAHIAVLRLRPNVEFLMAAAALGAIFLGDIVEAASVGAVVSFMDIVKHVALERFDRQLRGMVVGTPEKVDIVDGDSINVSDIVPGTVYKLRVGDLVPTDGTVTKGKATVNESQLTGEAMPQSKEKGLKVSSGSLIVGGYLEVTADCAADVSFQARVMDLVRDAQSTLSDAEEQVGRFAVWYTPAVILISVVVGFWYDLHTAIVVIVAGCPCALLAAAPFVHCASLTLLASKHQILMKHSTVLEAFGRMRIIGLDKTGTITRGNFALEEMIPTGKVLHDKKTLHQWIAAVEARDNHPLARSIVQSYTGCIATFHGSEQLPEVEEFKRHSRAGVSARVNGKRIGVGNSDHLAALEIPLEGDAASLNETWNVDGRTVLFATVDNQVAAVMVLSDTIKPLARATVQRLLSLGVQPLLLTGDKSESARRAASIVGIPAEDVHCGLLPEDKARILLEYSHGSTVPSDKRPLNTNQDRGEITVGFVGDGLNDCGALATANAGVVLQEVGSQATVDAAGAMLQSDIEELPAIVVVARRTMQLVMMNVMISLIINAIVIYAAVAYAIPLWLSVLCDSGGLLVILANSMWPLCWNVKPVKADDVGHAEDAEEMHCLSCGPCHIP